MTANVTATAISDRPAHSPADRLDGVERPTRRDEAWRYAPHDLLGRLSFGSPEASAESVPSAVEDRRIPALNGPRIVIVNGVVDIGQSDIAALPDGLRLAGLAADSAGPTGLVAAHFNADSGFAADAFVTINKTFGIGGAFIEVADGHRLADPIHLVDLVVPGDDRNTPCRGAMIHIGQGSSATIVETRTGSGTAFGGLNTRTSITLEADATLDHILLQDMPATQIHLSRVEVTQRAGSTLRARSFNLGAVYGRVAYDVHLDGVGAHADLSGLYFGSGDQTLDQQISVVHAARDCTSRQSYRGVLDDESTGVFNGGIDVRPGADGTDAQQSNDSLLLSDRAEANTQPRLEILADDVACKHGATIGQLDDAALYYLRTRGIAATDARRLLIDAFASQAVDDIDSDAVRTWIRERIGASDA
jgi:Fe-S cluster assembly protein SufD